MGPSPGSEGALPRAAWATIDFVVIVAVAIVGYAGGSGAFTAKPPSTPPVYTIENYSVTFNGSAADNFEVLTTGACPPSCGQAAVGGNITAVVTVSAVSYACSSLDQYEAVGAFLSPTGAFVLTSVLGGTYTSTGPLPAFVPWGNDTVCNGFAYVVLMMHVESQGPTTQPLFVTVTVSLVR